MSGLVQDSAKTRDVSQQLIYWTLNNNLLLY